MRFVLAAAALAVAFPAWAGDITVTDAYARSSGPTARTGAVFMTISNGADAPDRLIAARSAAAETVELHTHIADPATGVMKMRAVPDGFEIPAAGSYSLARGGDHVMLMGLTAPLADGDEIDLELEFEGGETLSVTVPVDLNRKPRHGGGMMHGSGG